MLINRIFATIERPARRATPARSRSRGLLWTIVTGSLLALLVGATGLGLYSRQVAAPLARNGPGSSGLIASGAGDAGEAAIGRIGSRGGGGGLAAGGGGGGLAGGGGGAGIAGGSPSGTGGAGPLGREPAPVVASRNPAESLDPEALRLFLDAAYRGDAEAQYMLGQSYERGLGGLQKNLEMAKLFYKLSADRGHANAQARLALISGDLDSGETSNGAPIPSAPVGRSLQKTSSNPTYQLQSLEAAPLWEVWLGLVVFGCLGWIALWHLTVRLRRRGKARVTSLNAASQEKFVATKDLAQVFVSYSRADTDSVDQLVGQIKGLGFHCMD